MKQRGSLWCIWSQASAGGRRRVSLPPRSPVFPPSSDLHTRRRSGPSLHSLRPFCTRAEPPGGGAGAPLLDLSSPSPSGITEISQSLDGTHPPPGRCHRRSINPATAQSSGDMEDSPQGSFEDIVLLLVLCGRPSPKKAEQETPWLGRGDKGQDSLGSHLSPSPEHELPEGRNSSQYVS